MSWVWWLLKLVLFFLMVVFVVFKILLWLMMFVEWRRELRVVMGLEGMVKNVVRGDGGEDGERRVLLCCG